ncbi:MAG: hypothetical protein J5761_01705 [Paludibacteraceae bacterium]|nr:hypothetical protein [Paludibacteraceae bacterium]
MNYRLLVAVCFGCVMVGCGHRGPSAAELHRAEKHRQDSIALVDQQRSLEYYQSQLEGLQPAVDSLLALFRYEKNSRYQDDGYYVMERGRLRVLVRDDARKEPVAYLSGQRIDLAPYRAHDSKEYRQLWPAEQQIIDPAFELYIVMADIRELEKRIQRTSLEIEKYQKRLEK